MTLRELSRRLPHSLSAPLLRLRERLFDSYAIKSYSHEGEDQILRRIFDGRRHGFYVDVGAHHPRRFSNTNYFYRRGWSGINIEPNPDVVRLFLSARPRDRNVQCGVASTPGTLAYYRFDEAALNTFDGEIAKLRLADKLHRYRLLGTLQVPVESLASILDKHLPSGQTIDFLSIDVEGFDLAVLKSNDWTRFRPACVLVESLDTSLEDAVHCDIFLFLKSQGYELFAKTITTFIFRERGRDGDGKTARSTA